MKKYLSMLVALLGLGFLLSGCGAAKLSPAVQESFQKQATMYTTRNMHYNIGRHAVPLIESTNYQVGMLIPVNSQVKMVGINSKQMQFLYKGTPITLKNVPKYSGVDINTVAEKYFSAKPVDLKKFSKAEQDAIKSATIVKGMSKASVLVSLGTPPAHRTPNVDADQWTYWRNRWTTFTVDFKNGKVLSNTPAPK